MRSPRLKTPPPALSSMTTTSATARGCAVHRGRGGRALRRLHRPELLWRVSGRKSQKSQRLRPIPIVDTPASRATIGNRPRNRKNASATIPPRPPSGPARIPCRTADDTLSPRRRYPIISRTTTYPRRVGQPIPDATIPCLSRSVGNNQSPCAGWRGGAYRKTAFREENAAGSRARRCCRSASRSTSKA